MLNESPVLTALNTINSLIEYGPVNDSGIAKTFPAVVPPVTEPSVIGLPPFGVTMKVRVSVSLGLNSRPVKLLTRVMGPLDINPVSVMSSVWAPGGIIVTAPSTPTSNKSPVPGFGPWAVTEPVCPHPRTRTVR